MTIDAKIRRKFQDNIRLMGVKQLRFPVFSCDNAMVAKAKNKLHFLGISYQRNTGMPEVSIDVPGEESSTVIIDGTEFLLEGDALTSLVWLVFYICTNTSHPFDSCERTRFRADINNISVIRAAEAIWDWIERFPVEPQIQDWMYTAAKNEAEALLIDMPLFTMQPISAAAFETIRRMNSKNLFKKKRPFSAKELWGNGDFRKQMDAYLELKKRTGAIDRACEKIAAELQGKIAELPLNNNMKDCILEAVGKLRTTKVLDERQVDDLDSLMHTDTTPESIKAKFRKIDDYYRSYIENKLFQTLVDQAGKILLSWYDTGKALDKAYNSIMNWRNDLQRIFRSTNNVWNDKLNLRWDKMDEFDLSKLDFCIGTQWDSYVLNDLYISPPAGFTSCKFYIGKQSCMNGLVPGLMDLAVHIPEIGNSIIVSLSCAQ